MFPVRKFDRNWGGMPLRWLPGDTFAAHALNVLHLVLPPGELWMCRLFNKALPLITDPTLAEDVKSMVGQEAAHASGHRAVLQYFTAHGFDLSTSQARLEHLFGDLLGERFLGKYRLGTKAARRWLLARLGMVAAIEHITCALGSWAFRNTGLETSGAYPDMVTLIKWHGAEEVEHRSVSFDLYRHLGGGYLQRIVLFVGVFAVFLLTWKRGTRAFLQQDPSVDRVYSLADYRASSRRNHLPSIRYMMGTFLRYLRPGHHPRKEASDLEVEQFLYHLKLADVQPERSGAATPAPVPVPLMPT